MTTKVDLDVIATAAQVADNLSDGLGTPHLVKVKPEVLLALVARIRELEAGLVSAAARIEGWVSCETQHANPEDDEDWKAAQELRELVCKGAVLP